MVPVAKLVIIKRKILLFQHTGITKHIIFSGDMPKVNININSIHGILIFKIPNPPTKRKRFENFSLNCIESFEYLICIMYILYL